MAYTLFLHGIDHEIICLDLYIAAGRARQFGQMEEAAMEEHDRLEEESNILVQTLKLMVIALGLVVMQFLGWSLLMPMIIGFALFILCTFTMRIVQGHRNHGRL